MPSLFSSAKTFFKKASKSDKKLSSNSSSSTRTDTTAELLYKYGYAGGVSVPVIPDVSKKLSKDISEKNEKKESNSSSFVKKQLPISQSEPALNTADLLYKYGFGNSPVPVIVTPRRSLKDKSNKKTQKLSDKKPATIKVFSPPELVVAPKLGRI